MQFYMPRFMNDVSDLASDAMKYKTVVDGVINSGILDDNEELKEKLNTAVEIVDKVQYLKEVATILKNSGWIEEGGTISKIAISLLGNAGPILSCITTSSVSAGTVAGITGAVASTSTASTIAGLVGGTAAGVGTAAGLVGGTAAGVGTAAAVGGGTAAAFATGVAATAAAPIVAGVAVAGAIGYGISKIWSSIWD